MGRGGGSGDVIFQNFVYILAAEKGAKNRGIRGGRVWVINMTQKNRVYLETLKIASIFYF